MSNKLNSSDYAAVNFSPELSTGHVKKSIALHQLVRVFYKT